MAFAVPFAAAFTASHRTSAAWRAIGFAPSRAEFCRPRGTAFSRVLLQQTRPLWRIGPEIGPAASLSARQKPYLSAVCRGAAEKHDCHSACNFDPLSRGIGVQN